MKQLELNPLKMSLTLEEATCKTVTQKDGLQFKPELTGMNQTV